MRPTARAFVVVHAGRHARYWLAVLLACSGTVPAALATGWPATLGYVLQAETLAPDRAAVVQLLGRSQRDLLVIDAAFTGGEGGAWTAAELDAIRAARPGRRIVCYLSIGEAERYRDYFPRIEGSDLVLAENPDWPGNYKVRYWRADWQRIITERAGALVARGFDGLYLDIVDAYQHFEHDARGDFQPERANPETGRTYRAEMVDFVRAISTAARGARPDALVIPQNGSDLLHDAAFRDAVDGIGVEDLFTLGDAAQDAGHTRQVLDNLAVLAGGRRFVLDIEYAQSGRERARAVREAGERGFVLLLTDRPLTILGTSYAPVPWH